MKTLVAVLIVICCLCHHSAGQYAPGLMLKGGCCKTHKTIPVPKGRIADMRMTPNDCKVQSVVITTVCNKQLCVGTKSQWVRQTLSEFEKLTANNKPPSYPFNVTEC